VPQQSKKTGRLVKLQSTVNVTVRREKALDRSECKSARELVRCAPAAIETMVEATKLSELSMERVARRLGEPAGRTDCYTGRPLTIKIDEQ